MNLGSGRAMGFWARRVAVVCLELPAPLVLLVVLEARGVVTTVQLTPETVPAAANAGRLGLSRLS